MNFERGTKVRRAKVRGCGCEGATYEGAKVRLTGDSRPKTGDRRPKTGDRSPYGTAIFVITFAAEHVRSFATVALMYLVSDGDRCEYDTA